VPEAARRPTRRTPHVRGVKEQGANVEIPETSTTLLSSVAQPQHARWAVFVARYEPLMRAFLHARFPTLEADDIIQETFVALVNALPDYRYDPRENGHFHNYLTGVLRNKALKAHAGHRRDERLKARLAAEAEVQTERVADGQEDRTWRDAVYAIALRQLLAEESIHARTKQIFIRLAIDGRSPQQVAEAFGTSTDAVVKVKTRLLARLRNIVKALKNV